MRIIKRCGRQDPPIIDARQSNLSLNTETGTPKTDVMHRHDVVSAEHVHSMAMRLGSPRFMLHDLRKMLATVGEKLGISSAVQRRILNHTAPKTDVLHLHYVGLAVTDVLEPMVKIQEALVGLTGNSGRGA